MLFSENANLFNQGSRVYQTDRQTDRITMAIPALCIIVHRAGKNRLFVCRNDKFEKSENDKIVNERIKIVKNRDFFLRDKNRFERTEQLRSSAVTDVNRLPTNFPTWSSKAAV